MKAYEGLTAFRYKFVIIFLFTLAASILLVSFAPGLLTPGEPDFYRPYMEFLEKIYKTMDDGYYMPISRYRYDEFVKKYKDQVLSKLTVTDHVVPMVAWRGAGLLTIALRDTKDKFTNFIPPQGS
ncbi:MAG: hypothetical protein HQL30_07310 [Candidatus Omnitrophica bacterium]|nr:hypothetical protein [Candidatus Omnitrophota bacterium]